LEVIYTTWQERKEFFAELGIDFKNKVHPVCIAYKRNDDWLCELFPDNMAITANKEFGVHSEFSQLGAELDEVIINMITGELLTQICLLEIQKWLIAINGEENHWIKVALVDHVVDDIMQPSLSALIRKLTAPPDIQEIWSRLPLKS